MFEPGRIYLQMIRLCQPTFSTALIAHIEASIPGETEKQALAEPIPMPDTIVDWTRGTIASFNNARAWGAHASIRPWLDTCRLNAAAAWTQIPADNTEGRALRTRMTASIAPALDNLDRLTASM